MKNNQFNQLIVGLTFLLSASALLCGIWRQDRVAVFAQEQVTEKQDGDTRIIAIGPRPLRDALQILEQQLGCVITYADPAFEAPSMVQEVFPGGFVIPRSHSVSFTYESTKKSEPITVIQALLNRYHQQDETVRFKVVPSKINGRIFNVTPSFEENERGKLVASRSLLDTKISLDKTATYASIAGDISKQVSDASGGRRVGTSRPPTWIFLNKKVTLKSSGASALASLNALVSNYNSKEQDMLSWSFAIDPRLNFGTINIHRVVPVEELANSVGLSVETERPLADVSKVLQQQLKSVTVYEDPPYLCSCQIWRNKAGQPQGLAGGIFNFAYSSNDKPPQVLSDTVEAFNRHSAGKFVVKQVGEVFYIHPTEFMNEKDQTLPLKPVLETSISLSANEKPASEILKTLCEKLAAETKQKVTLGELPTSPAFARALSYEAAQPAVKHLADLSKKLGGNVSWQLLYEPRLKGYTLNAHLIGN